MKMKGNLLFVLVVFVFCFLSCSQDKGLEKFQKIALGSWTAIDGDEFDSLEITEDKIKMIFSNEVTSTIAYRFDNSKIYLNEEWNDQWIEWGEYNIFAKDSFTITSGDIPIEFKIIDKNTASISALYDGEDILKIKRSGSISDTRKSSGKTSALLGRWSLDEGPKRNNPEEMDFLRDGTGIVDGKGISWKIENGRFYLIHPSMAFSSIYNVSGSTLTLTKDDGVVLKYKKK